MEKKNVETITLAELPLNQIFPNPDQPRKHFDPAKLGELAASIKEHGVQQPIKVTPKNDGYMIVMGERRWRASRLAGKKTVPVIIEQLTADQVQDLATIENILREDLNIIEEARAYKSYINRGLTVEAIQKKMGFTKKFRIEWRLSLLNLTPELQDHVVKETITSAQALEMAKLKPALQDVVFRKIVAGELNTQSKLTTFIDALISQDSQASFFALATLSEQDKKTLGALTSSLQGIERFIRNLDDPTVQNSLQKAALHTDIRTERLDLIIKALTKVKKAINTGTSIRSVVELAT